MIAHLAKAIASVRFIYGEHEAQGLLDLVKAGDEQGAMRLSTAALRPEVIIEHRKGVMEERQGQRRKERLDRRFTEPTRKHQ